MPVAEVEETGMAHAAASSFGDAADRLILDEAAEELRGARVLAIGSAELAAGARELGAADVRYYSDADPSTDLDAALLAGVTVVLLRLAPSLDWLDRVARLVAISADPGVVVFAGGRLKYMTRAMNEVLGTSFARVDVSLARQKSRVLVAREPRQVEPQQPRSSWIGDLGLRVAAVGGVFAGASLDIGTRAMLDAWATLPAYGRAIDLGCGSGILAAQLKRLRPGATVVATDASADAVASAAATMAANDLDVEVVRDLGLRTQADASADLIVVNPPFHDRGAVSKDAALAMFADAARVLRPGGQLWVVWNSHLGYRSALAATVGQTLQVARTPKFTVTASTKAAA